MFTGVRFQGSKCGTHKWHIWFDQNPQSPTRVRFQVRCHACHHTCGRSQIRGRERGGGRPSPLSVPVGYVPLFHLIYKRKQSVTQLKRICRAFRFSYLYYYYYSLLISRTKHNTTQHITLFSLLFFLIPLQCPVVQNRWIWVFTYPTTSDAQSRSNSCETQ